MNLETALSMAIELMKYHVKALQERDLMSSMADNRYAISGRMDKARSEIAKWKNAISILGDEKRKAAGGGK